MNILLNMLNCSFADIAIKHRKICKIYFGSDVLLDIRNSLTLMNSVLWQLPEMINILKLRSKYTYDIKGQTE